MKIYTPIFINNITKHLDYYDIITLYNVCKSWKSNIPKYALIDSYINSYFPELRDREMYSNWIRCVRKIYPHKKIYLRVVPLNQHNGLRSYHITLVNRI